METQITIHHSHEQSFYHHHSSAPPSFLSLFNNIYSSNKENISPSPFFLPSPRTSLPSSFPRSPLQNITHLLFPSHISQLNDPDLDFCSTRKKLKCLNSVDRCSLDSLSEIRLESPSLLPFTASTTGRGDGSGQNSAIQSGISIPEGCEVRRLKRGVPETKVEQMRGAGEAENVNASSQGEGTGAEGEKRDEEVQEDLLQEKLDSEMVGNAGRRRVDERGDDRKGWGAGKWARNEKKEAEEGIEVKKMGQLIRSKDKKNSILKKLR